jgi:hypothetical protein
MASNTQMLENKMFKKIFEPAKGLNILALFDVTK